ncbi:ComEA family DNA-binding protein [Xylanimonas protaetiae]|uniref:ComEA family DNA-binding protein n=2 Tax=Xylanimonas protaetiae TaxID=2509457 RepID=A0A4P6F7C1_9MICO|nr:ComEA family DNA-binding protein [Xylanimonas protaetiae]
MHGHVAGGSEEELDAVGGQRWALRPRTALVAVGAVLVLAAALAVVASWPHQDVDAVALAPVADASAAPQAPLPEPAASPTPSALVVVDVVGQVQSPGLVTLPAGSRVFDAVAAAGGATDGAELGAINLARPVVDGEQVRVPAPGEVVAAAAPPDGGTGEPSGAGGRGAGLVDLNTADEAALDTLPGIGPALAARIVAWRTDNGPFASVDELDEVAGIGPAMLAKVRDLVTV